MKESMNKGRIVAPFFLNSRLLEQWWATYWKKKQEDDTPTEIIHIDVEDLPDK